MQTKAGTHAFYTKWGQSRAGARDTGGPIAHGTSECARDGIFHDLGSSTVDSMNARRGVQLGDWILIHVAGAAVQLHATVHDPTLELREPELCHRRSTVVELTAQHSGDAVIVESPAVGDLRMHLGQNELRVLEIENPLTESLAVLDEKLGRVARLHAHLVEVPAPDVPVPRALDEE